MCAVFCFYCSFSAVLNNLSVVAAFAPMNAAPESQESRDLNWNAQRRPFDPDRFARD